MHTLRTEDRDRSMSAIVSFHDVPIPRGVGFAIRDIETDGAPVSIFSADRTVPAVREHNRQFGTSLSAQQELIDAFRAGRGNPANPVDRTSHCYRCDDTIANLLNDEDNGLDRLRATDGIPWWAVGIDMTDRGKVEDVSSFLRVARWLGYRFLQPYSSGQERHHVILTRSPILNLERRNQISRNRKS